MTQASDVLHARQGDPEYARLASAEAEHWARPEAVGVAAFEATPRGRIERYTSQRFTGDADTEWFETIARYGRFRRGLMLGTSGARHLRGILKSNASLHMTVVDISEPTLERDARLIQGFTDRVTMRCADLNFATFEPDAYDLIVSSSTLHHVINLEHTAFAVNAALKTDGFFFLQDYVGEARYRFSQEKKRLFSVLCERDARRNGRFPLPLRWIDGDSSGTHSPLCAIRSDEILPVMRRFLTEIEVRTAAALIMPMLFSRPEGMDAPSAVPPEPARRGIAAALRVAAAWRGQRHTTEIEIDPRFWEELLLVDGLVCDAGLLTPCNAFAIYRKGRNE